ncbi:DEKNAAC103731 [Brettanomyces naardenensis]|uniref:DEKNAAC103731 n=1 Tax=Brettanomyces naardenensis TaxID=13370 RepID=A0A448YP17_BRENA|nr:DEKNAAC103731 [Brettanomyces naardenensis]
MKHPVASKKVPRSKKAKRERSSRACLVCRQRKVKCDAMQRYPDRCTNCMLFNIPHCSIPQPKKRQSKKLSQFLLEHELLANDQQSETEYESNDGSQYEAPDESHVGTYNFSSSSQTQSSPPRKPPNGHVSTGSVIPASLSSLLTSDPQDSLPEISAISLDAPSLLKKIFRPDPVFEYMGSTGPAPIIKQVLNDYLESRKKSGAKKSRLDALEFHHLEELGCFKLPEKELCDKYIDAYFKAVHWQQPVLDKARFLRDYKDLLHPPSLLLLQAVLFSGSRAYEESFWTDKDLERQEHVTYVLHRRAQALYNAKIEQSPLPLLQSLIIFGTYWDSDFISSKNSFFSDLNVAICTAYCMGLHRSHAKSTDLSESDKKLFKRIWWTLFMRDCFYSFTFGRPWMVDIERSDVEALTEDDIECDEEGEGEGEGESVSSTTPSSSHPTSPNSLYFLYRLKLAMVTRRVANHMQQIRLRAARNVSSIPLLEECDRLLTGWLGELPNCLLFTVNGKDNNFYSAALAIEYYSVVLVVHRSNIVRKSLSHGATTTAKKADLEYYPSWSITFKSAHLITLIGQYLLHENYLTVYHCFVVYSMVSAGVMMIYHLYNRDKTVSEVADHDIKDCLEVMTAASVKWPISKLGGFYLEAIYSDKLRQFTLIRDILNAANKEIVTVKPENQSMLDDSFKPYRGNNEFLMGNPTLSAQRGTPIRGSTENSGGKSTSSSSNSIKEDVSSTSSPSDLSDSNKVTDASVKSILYNGTGPSTADIIYPMSRENSRRGSNKRDALGRLAEAATALNDTPNGNSLFTSFADQQGGVTENSFPQSINDNWLPSFDTSAFPNSPVGFDGGDAVDDLFDYIGSTDLGVYGWGID